MDKTLSIVIITRNTKDLVTNLIDSIAKDCFLSAHLREIIIVDNGSDDGTREAFEARGPGLCYLRNESNCGFAAAVNRGWKKAKGAFVLFLNSDTRVVPGSVEQMIDVMVANSRIAVCGPQLVYEDLRLQRSTATVPSILFEIIPRSLWERVVQSRPSSVTKGDSGDPRPVDSLIGAAIVVKKDVLQNMEGFDERFFFFLEETDFCIRARKAGYDVVSVPKALIIHLQGKTVGKQWVNGRIEYNISLYKFIRKYHSLLYYRAFQFLRVLKSTLFLLVLTCCFPLVLFRRRTKRSYLYYTRLLRWHLKGCPDHGGLRISPRE